MRPVVLALLCTIAGCGPSAVIRTIPDAASHFDLAMAQAVSDSGTPSPDLAITGPRYRFAFDKVFMPLSKTDYGYAENGDGFPHNQFAVLALWLDQINLPLSPAEDSAIAIDGDAITLISIASVDPGLVTDPKAVASLYVAKAQRLPDLSGSGSFEINPQTPAGRLAGNIASANFLGQDPSNLSVAPTAPLRLALIGTQRVTLTLVGAHVTFVTSKTGLMSGQLHGAIKGTDIDRVLIPALASNLNELAHRMPCDADCATAKTTFDKIPVDGTINAGEVKAVLANQLKPDIQLFDARGGWAPNHANTTPDSYTLGIGFSAKTAKFSE